MEFYKYCSSPYGCLILQTFLWLWSRDQRYQLLYNFFLPFLNVNDLQNVCIRTTSTTQDCSWLLSDALTNRFGSCESFVPRSHEFWGCLVSLSHQLSNSILIPPPGKTSWASVIKRPLRRFLISSTSQEGTLLTLPTTTRSVLFPSPSSLPFLMIK